MSVIDNRYVSNVRSSVNRVGDKAGGFIHWAFLTPALILYVTFLVLPTLGIFYIAFFYWSGYGAATFAGVDNFVEVLRSDLLVTTSVNVTLYVVSQLVIVTGGGLLVALAVRATYPKLRSFFQTAIFLPMVLMTVAVSLIWAFIYNPAVGVMNSAVLPALGLDWTPTWLADPSLALAAIIVAVSWQWIGFNMSIWLVGLQNINEEYYEAARIGGVGAYRQFRHLTLPLLRPIGVFLVTFTIIGSLRTFAYFWVMTQGGPGHATEVIVTWMYKAAFNERRFGKAAAVSTILFIVTMAVSVINLKILGLGKAGE